MIQCTLDPKAFITFAREQGLDPGRGELDLGHLGHAWFKAAFGDLTPSPWRLFTPIRSGADQPHRILGYSSCSHEVLRDHMAHYAAPSAMAVCPPEGVQGKSMPQDWPKERYYAFECLCCPVGRKARTGREKDVFLIEADRTPGHELSRAQVYQQWFKAQVERVPGVQISEVALSGFRLASMVRKTHTMPRLSKVVRRPQAQFRGVLQATDGASLLSLLQRGVGRHRSYGFGMILIRPHR